MLDDVLTQINADSRVVRLFDPNLMPTPGQPFALRVSWPNANIAQFQAWVKKLRSSVDLVLRDLFVPPVETLRAIAQDPRVYGVVLDDVTPRRLDGLFRDSSVSSVSVGDIGFHAGRPSS